MILENTPNIKFVKSEKYNYLFNKKSGFFARWGKTMDDDPSFSPFGPEIADIEISTICSGLNKPCKFCYKSNTANGKNMSFRTFKKVFKNLPKNLTQIAFGIGDINANKDLWKIMKYCRGRGVIPNITINGYNLSGERAELLSEICGAVAVSRYNPKDYCYTAIKQLTDLGMKQVNIHMLLAEETYQDCLETLDDIIIDSRLKNMYAIVFLSLKPKGRGKGYTQLSKRKFNKIIRKAMDKNILFGFDSCSAPKFLDAIKKHHNYNSFKDMAEPCESYLFSTYINVDGKMFPCSFTEKGKGIDLTKNIDFIKDVWYNKTVISYRNKILSSKDRNNCRKCFKYNV
jgi:radical SAM protein with 4Fe4S-binding SPASM domain